MTSVCPPLGHRFTVPTDPRVRSVRCDVCGKPIALYAGDRCFCGAPAALYSTRCVNHCPIPSSTQ